MAGRVPGLALAVIDAIDREIREALSELSSSFTFDGGADEPEEDSEAA